LAAPKAEAAVAVVEGELARGSRAAAPPNLIMHRTMSTRWDADLSYSPLTPSADRLRLKDRTLREYSEYSHNFIVDMHFLFY
jgi:hypothetical protein